jgi:hypothetical protein
VYVSERSTRERVGSLLFAPVAAVGWVFLALLGLAVKLALFRTQRTQGATAVLWGLGFGLFLWAGTRSVGLEQTRAILLGLVGAAASALFIYVRGSGLEDPPEAQPGAFFRRLRARGRSTPQASRPRGPDATKTRELQPARVALTDGDLDAALFYLRDAERVAVAQRKLDELLQVRDLLGSLPRTQAGERLAQRISEDLYGFPADELAAAGIHVQTERELVESLRRTVAKSRELAPARAAIDAGDFKQALFQLQEAARVAIAQRKLDELLEVDELVRSLSEQSSGRTRAASEQLERKIEAGLLSFLPAPYP